MKKIILSLMLLCALCACSSSDDTESKDMTYPEISDQGIVAVPIDCQVFKRGEVIPFNYLFTDDTELGAYNIEIHHNGANRSLTIVYGENHITVRITDQGRLRLDSNLLLEGPPIDGRADNIE